MRARGGIFAAFLAGALAAAPPGAAATATAQPSEAAVKAAFLTKFAGYVAWPAAARPAPGAPLLLCVIGGDPFGQLVEQASRGQQIDGHPVLVKRIANPAEAAGCHLAFVQGSASKSTAEMLAGLDKRPVLTITDARAGPQRGMIHFVLQEGRVRFHIDEAAAARNGLAINSRLLGIALSVRQRH